MRKRFAIHLMAPVVCAGFLFACGGGDEPRPQRPVTAVPEGQAGEGPGGQGPQEGVGAGQTVALSGCVEGAPGTGQYVLRYVRIESREGLDPHRDTTTAGAHGITEGSWVRLDGADREEDLRNVAGHRVTLTGVVADTGESTVGTAGTTGVPAVSGGAPSQAADDRHYSERVKDETGRIARESMADGTAALVRVTGVDSTGERCPMDVRQEKR